MWTKAERERGRGGKEGWERKRDRTDRKAYTDKGVDTQRQRSRLIPRLIEEGID